MTEYVQNRYSVQSLYEEAKRLRPDCVHQAAKVEDMVYVLALTVASAKGGRVKFADIERGALIEVPKKSSGKDLAQIIRDNPGCVAIVDNDWWALHKVHPDLNPHSYSEEKGLQEDWEERNELANAGDEFSPRLGDGGYGSGNCYGGDLLQALAKIVGITVESV